MWLQFFLENFHFAIDVFVGLVFFAVFWLYYDAWLIKKDKKELPKFFGFLFVSFSFLAHATFVESTILPVSFLNSQLMPLLSAITRLVGYFLIAYHLSREPLPQRPEVKLEAPFLEKSAPSFLGFFSKISFQLLFPILPFLIGKLYLTRSTKGMERQLRPVSIAFFILAGAELASLASIFRETSNASLYKLVSPFGLVWMVEHITFLAAGIVLGKWVWGYLLKRILTQLFMIFTLVALAVFLITTVSFSTILITNLQQETFIRLETDVKVLDFALESKKEEALSAAVLIAQNAQVRDALISRDRGRLGDLLENFLLAKKYSFLVGVNENGEVIGRGEDKARAGDSLSDDPAVKKALLGEEVKSVVAKGGVLAPEIFIQVAVPVKSANRVVGAITTGLKLDNAFVDGVKSTTGLESSIYGGNTLSATTLVSSDGKTRPLGTKEENKAIKKKTLEEGKSFVGSSAILNTPYFAAYLPLKNIEEKVEGMLFVGRPQVTVLQAAGRSIQATFIVTALLIVLSIIPAYFVARNISSQLE